MFIRLAAALVFAALPTFTLAAPAQEQDKEAYEVYVKGREMGTELFLEFMNEGNGHGYKLLHVSSVLGECGNEGLEKAVEATNTDRNFSKRLAKYVGDGKFRGVTRNLVASAIAHAQNTANSLSVGFSIGVRYSVALLPSAQKDALCRSAVSSADGLLR
jgi:hypothetical protein